jgi:hypothetical protein
MKKLIAALVTLVFISANSPTLAQAAVKSGAACPKAGKTSTSNGRIFTCIKLGTKLYWNNGMQVKPAPQKTDLASVPVTGTVSQQNASKRAASYLRSSSFSRSSLIKQLEYEGFSNADATFGADSLKISWTDQAVKRAASYLRNSSFSRSSLIKQLEFEGFSNADSVFGTDAQKADWNQQAALRAASYLKNSAFSRTGLLEQLEYEGFTAIEAEYGVSRTGL